MCILGLRVPLWLAQRHRCRWDPAAVLVGKRPVGILELQFEEAWWDGNLMEWRMTTQRLRIVLRIEVVTFAKRRMV